MTSTSTTLRTHVDEPALCLRSHALRQASSHAAAAHVAVAIAPASSAPVVAATADDSAAATAVTVICHCNNPLSRHCALAAVAVAVTAVSPPGRGAPRPSRCTQAATFAGASMPLRLSHCVTSCCTCTYTHELLHTSHCPRAAAPEPLLLSARVRPATVPEVLCT